MNSHCLNRRGFLTMHLPRECLVCPQDVEQIYIYICCLIIIKMYFEQKHFCKRKLSKLRRTRQPSETDSECKALDLRKEEISFWQRWKCCENFKRKFPILLYSHKMLAPVSIRQLLPDFNWNAENYGVWLTAHNEEKNILKSETMYVRCVIDLFFWKQRGGRGQPYKIYWMLFFLSFIF